MTLQKYPLTILSLSVNALCFIVIYLLYHGYWDASAITNAPTVGLTPAATVKIIALPSYACVQWMKLNVKPETTASILFTSPCQEESLLSILDTWTY
jgi:hypothetical protein